MQQFFREFQRSESGVLNGRKDVKSALGFEAVQSHVAKPLYHQPATFVILGNHAFTAGAALLERFHRSDLRSDGCAEHGELMNFGHGGDEIFIAKGVADTPAGHCIGFGEAVEQNRPVAHSRQ